MYEQAGGEGGGHGGGETMSFKDHPVFLAEAVEGPGAVIIGIHDRFVQQPEHRVVEPLPVAEVSLRRTAARLARLAPTDWSVLQHPNMGADHLVVGIGGVYAVTTTRLVGKVLVAAGVMIHNGHCTDHLSRVEQQASRLSARLHTPVRALLVVDAESLHVRDEPLDVGVTSSHRVRAWLEQRPATLDAATMFRVAARAQRPRTWV